jgi:PAS domain S-box-containing protein
MIRGAPQLSEIEAFVIAVDEGSIAQAAHLLHITPAAAAKRIRQLEALAQGPLLERGARGVQPTEIGTRLYPSALGTIAGAPVGDLLHQTEALLSAVFHATDQPLFITKADHSLVCEINDAAACLTGYEQGEVRGRQVTELRLWTDVDASDDLVRRAISTGLPQAGDLVLIDKHGTTHPVRSRFEAIELHRTTYVVVTLKVLVR